MKRSIRPSAVSKLHHSFDRLEPRAMLDAVPLLPDIFPWADQSRGYLYDWVVQGDLLRFTTAFANNGAGHLELRGGAIVNGRQEVWQRIFYSDGTYQDRLAGHFTYHPGHGHIHFDGYAIHNLRQVTAGNGVGDIVATGGKISFCLIDITKYNPNAGPSRYNSCGQIQGVTAGWSDVYNRNLADQWINISLVPDGQYWLEVVVDPDHLLLESNPDNNVARVLVNINRGGPTGGDRWEPNNTFAAATNLGVLSHYHEVGLSIHNATDQDYFRIGAPEHGEFDIHANFTHALGNLDMFVYDQNQNLIASSTSLTDNEEIHFHAHPGEWYYLVVRGVDGATNGYELEIWGPGHTVVEVVDSTDVPRSIPDGVGSGNPGPWVTSTLVAPAIQITDLNLIFGKLDHTWLGDLEIQLVSPQGTVGKILTSQFQPGGGLLGNQDHFVNTRMDDQAALNLAQGTAPYTGWFRINHANTGANPLSVFNGENSEGVWTLRIRDWHSADIGTLRNWSIMFTGIDLNPGDRFEPNNFFPQAVDLGTLGIVTIEDVNIHNTTDRDFFRFIAGASAPTQIRVEFVHAKGNLDVLVYDSSLNEVARGDSHDDNEILNFVAAANETYYIQIFGVQGAVNDYTLTVDVAPVIGETGLIPAVDHVWQRVNFARTFVNPVVVVSPASYHDVNPATVTIRHVNATGFEVRISRWNYQPAAHGTETLGYLVVEAGSHILADGSWLVAGVQPSVSHAFQNIPFGASFSAPPVVLAQVSSANNGRTSVPRIANVSNQRFGLRIQEQELQPTNRYTPQSVQWIAIQRGQDFAGNWQYQAGTKRFPNQNPTPVFYAETFRNLPIVLASAQTFLDADPISIRLTDVKSNKATIFMQEEKSLDAEMAHGAELIGYLAFSGPWLFARRDSGFAPLVGSRFASPQPNHPCGCASGRAAPSVSSTPNRTIEATFTWGALPAGLEDAVTDSTFAFADWRAMQIGLATPAVNSESARCSTSFVGTPRRTTRFDQILHLSPSREHSMDQVVATLEDEKEPTLAAFL